MTSTWCHGQLFFVHPGCNLWSHCLVDACFKINLDFPRIIKWCTMSRCTTCTTILARTDSALISIGYVLSALYLKIVPTAFEHLAEKHHVFLPYLLQKTRHDRCQHMSASSFTLSSLFALSSSFARRPGPTCQHSINISTCWNPAERKNDDIDEIHIFFWITYIWLVKCRGI